MSKKEKRGIIIFVVIILLEIVVFWGNDILTLFDPSFYFTEGNIEDDIIEAMEDEPELFVLNESAPSLSKKYLGDVTIVSEEITDTKAKIEVSTYWEGADPMDVLYTFSLVYAKDGSSWELVNLKGESEISAEKLVGSWETNLSQEGDFFHSEFNYDIEYRIEKVNGTDVSGSVIVTDRMGTDNDTSTFVAVWNERNGILEIILEHPVTSNQFGAGDLYYNPVKGVLISGDNEYIKTK